MELLKIFINITEKLKANKALLNDLDQQIGDGDHGTNIVRGFESIINAPDKVEGLPMKTALNNCAMLLISQVGGSSGPLLGTCFMKMAQAINDTCTKENIFAAFKAGFEGIEMRGKSVVGEKTMLDAYAPALDAFEKNMNESWHDIFVAMANAAETGSEMTKDIIATKGRASYLKERSVGHIDPGSKSVAIIFAAIAEVI